MKPLRSLVAKKQGVLLFFGGTATAQLITIASSLVIARLYGPSEFGVFAMFAAVSTTMATLTGWRYEVAIVIPETDEEARAVMLLSCGLGVLWPLALLAALLVSWMLFGDFLGHDLTLLICIALPVNVWLIHLLVVLRHWTNRFRRYPLMAGIAMFETLAISVISILLGYYSFGTPGLIIGAVIGRMVTMLLLVFKGVERDEKWAMLRTDREAVRSVATRFRNHPRHLLPAQTIGVLGRQMPVFTLSLCFDSSVVGLYSMAQRFVSLPTTTIAKAVGEIYRERVGRRVRNGKAFRDLFQRTLIALASIGFVAMSLIYLFAPQIIELALGDTWGDVSVYIRILLVAAFFQFVFVPIDKGGIIVGRTGFFFFWHLVRFVAGFIALAIVYIGGWSPIPALWLLVVVNAMIYLANGAANFSFSNTVIPKTASDDANAKTLGTK